MKWLQFKTFYSENNQSFMIRDPSVSAFLSTPFIEKSRFHSPNLLYPKDCTSSSSAKSSV